MDATEERESIWNEMELDAFLVADFLFGQAAAVRVPEVFPAEGEGN